MDLDSQAFHVYFRISFFLRKVLVILRSLNEANSLNVCPFLFMQSSPKVPTIFRGFAKGLVILQRKKMNKLLISTDAQPWISLDQMTNYLARKRKK